MEVLCVLIAAVIVLAIGVAVVVPVIAHRQAQRRTGEIRQWAAAHGFSYAPGHVTFPDASSRSPFNRSGRNSNHLEGGFNGHRARAYQHTVTTTSRDSEGRTQSQSHHYAIAAVPHPTGPGFHLDFAPQGVFGRLADKMGFGTLTGDAEFDREFKVRTNDHQQMLWVLRPEVTMWITRDPRFRSAPVRIDNGWLMTWYTGRLNVGMLNAQFGLLTEVAARLPR